MKKSLIFLFALISINSLAQFPAPINLTFSYFYVTIDQTGYCNGQWVVGPTYCSHFEWNKPDTLITSTHLAHYNVYYYPMWETDTLLIATSVDTFFTDQIGILGKVWVTAIYSNPDGESAPSNSIINYNLPISIEENATTKGDKIIYNSLNQSITISDLIDWTAIKVIDATGKVAFKQTQKSSSVSLGQLHPGIYIIQVLISDNTTLEKKILVQN